jgi:uncharacterized protein
MPHLSRILLYPIKSLDGVEVPEATLLASGALRGDREWAIVDSRGKFVNGKRTPLVHGLRSTFDLQTHTVTLVAQKTGKADQFDLVGDRTALETWLSEYFGFPVQMTQNAEMGFPDDPQSPGPTVISTATLTAVSEWFAGMDVEGARSRFRTNLEIGDCDAFWEDHLFGAPSTLPAFQVGAAEFLGVNPCQRCIVPTRDAITGEPIPNFQKVFGTKRRETLPKGVDPTRFQNWFNHFYRLAVNTRTVGQAEKVLRVGDKVQPGPHRPSIE